MRVQFAQVNDYYQFTTGQDAPDTLTDAEVAQLNADLLRASDTIRRAVRLARISWDPNTGFPIDPVVARGLADATSAQAAWNDEQGDITGAASNWNNVSMGPVSLARNATAAGATTAAGFRHAPEVDDILATLPIWSTAVINRGA